MSNASEHMAPDIELAKEAHGGDRWLIVYHADTGYANRYDVYAGSIAVWVLAARTKHVAVASVVRISHIEYLALKEAL